jgi:hypothetical protein
MDGWKEGRKKGKRDKVRGHTYHEDIDIICTKKAFLFYRISNLEAVHKFEVVIGYI